MARSLARCRLHPDRREVSRFRALRLLHLAVGPFRSGATAIINAKSSTIIARPPAEVFAFLTDVHNQPLWHHRALRAAPDIVEPLVVGSTWSAVVRRVPPPGVRHLHFTITEYLPDQRLMSWTQSLPYEMGSGYELTPENGQTRVVCTRTIRLRGLWRLIRPLIQWIVNRDIIREAADLKLVLESRVPPPDHVRM